MPENKELQLTINKIQMQHFSREQLKKLIKACQNQLKCYAFGRDG